MATPIAPNTEIKEVTSEDKALPIPDRGEVLSFEEALKSYRKGDYETALTLFKSVDTRKFESSKDFYIGNCLYKLGSFNEAEFSWLQAVKYHDNSSLPYVNLGNLNYERRNEQKAMIFWHKALIEEPECEVANWNIASFYSMKGYRDLAIEAFRRCLKYLQDKESEHYKAIDEFIFKIDRYCDVFIEKATPCFERHDYNQAMEYYLKAINNNPANYRLANFLGDLYFKTKNYTRALEYHLLAYRHDPIKITSVLNTALCFDKLGYKDYAFCFYRRALPIISTKSESYNTTALLLKNSVPGVLGNQTLFNEHIRSARAFEKESLYQKALEEYENAFFIISAQEEIIIEKIKTLKTFVDPEKIMIDKLLPLLDKYFEEDCYEKVIPIAKRLMNISRENTYEYRQAENRGHIARNQLEKKDKNVEEVE